MRGLARLSFASLVLAAALAAFVACVESDDVRAPADAAPEAHDDDDATRVIPPSPPSPPPPSCPSPAFVDSVHDVVPWAAPPPPSPGACSAKELADIDGVFGPAFFNPKLTLSDFDALYARLSAGCRACIATDVDASWSVFVFEDGGLYEPNIGACPATVSGATACGFAQFELSDCEFIACEDCRDASALPECLTRAQKSSACVDYVDAMVSACADAGADVLAPCASVGGSARVLCGN